MKSMIIYAYFGFGVGMLMNITHQHDIMFNKKKIEMPRLIIFLILFLIAWPIKFYHPIVKHFSLENIKTKEIVPL